MTAVDPVDPTRHKTFPTELAHEDLLVPVLRDGRMVGAPPALPEIRARAQAQLAALHAGVRRLDNPHAYPAGLERSLHERKLAMIEAARSAGAAPCA